MDVAQKNVLVVGMAQSGLAAAELLARHGARVTAADLNPTGQPVLDRLGIPLVRQTPEVFAGRDLIVIAPGVPADLSELEAARAGGVPVIGEVELAGYWLKGKVIGITGANGKTTTTALTGHILKESGIAGQVGGNIGLAPARMIDSSRAEQWNVLELSSFQLETTEQFHVNTAVVVNVTPDHLDRHHTFENYAAAKGRIFRNQTGEDAAVLNADDETCVGYARQTRARVVWFSRRQPVPSGIWANGGHLVCDTEPFLRLADIPLRGGHNVENVMAASAAAQLAGAPLERIAAAVKTFPGVEHRLEFVREIDGVAYYNDSKATNVDAALKAIEAFPGGLWVILGGKDKGSDYRPLRDPLAAKARRVLLIGAAAEKIERQLSEGTGGRVAMENRGTLEGALRRARGEAAAGEVVLLAPACASFDQFRNFEHRGQTFKEVVSALAAEAGR
jgi:UDP-N-acetylmuramoylalanine--D-glutamate ligase